MTDAIEPRPAAPPATPPTPRHWYALTACVWTTSLIAKAVAALIVIEFLFMATTLDPIEMYRAGAAPWEDAAFSVVGFIGLILVGVLGLRLWHSRRLWVAGLALVVLQVGCVGWVCAKMYGEYF